MIGIISDFIEGVYPEIITNNDTCSSDKFGHIKDSVRILIIIKIIILNCGM